MHSFLLLVYTSLQPGENAPDGRQSLTMQVNLTILLLCCYKSAKVFRYGISVRIYEVVIDARDLENVWPISRNLLSIFVLFIYKRLVCLRKGNNLHC